MRFLLGFFRLSRLADLSGFAGRFVLSDLS